MIRKEVLVIVLSLCVLSLTGCVWIPQEELSLSINEEELSDHVHFLAQPALKGRRPKSFESVITRQYLKKRFEAYGLVPWPGAKGFEQPFVFGTNVIGVLPGSDPNLADEIVILAAHYDHVGKTKDGVLLGACDNASGVAALLEIAEHFSLAKEKPKRSICFASFDCEEYMLLGSFVFSCQKDFEKQKIAAVVNIDMLGRDFLDVVEDSLFVAGTENYPQLRGQVAQLEKDAGLNIFQLGTKMIGPRGDHVAFETMGVPVLFFCCGLNKDYHKSTDTAEKLDYSAIEKSAKVIAGTVEMLANSRQIEKPVVPQTGDKGELRAVKFILEKINANRDNFKLKDEQDEELQALVLETQRLLDEENYTAGQHKNYVRQATEALLPVCVGAENNAWYLTMHELYSEHSEFLIEYFRNTIKEIIESKPGLFNMPEFEFNVFLVGDDGLSFIENEDGQCQLDMIILRTPEWYIHPKKSWFKRRGISFSLTHSIKEFAGTKEQVVDYCLLKWRKNLTDESYRYTWEHILSVVTGQEPGRTYHGWLEWRLGEEVSESEWMYDLLESGHQHLVFLTGLKMPEADSRTPKELQAIIRDRNASSDERTRAISALRDASRDSLLTLVEILDDETPRAGYLWSPRYMDESYPLANHRAVKEARKNWKKQLEEGPGTVGEYAKNILRYLANRNRGKQNKMPKMIMVNRKETVPIIYDFGKDAKAWRKWIRSNVK